VSLCQCRSRRMRLGESERPRRRGDQRQREQQAGGARDRHGGFCDVRCLVVPSASR